MKKFIWLFGENLGKTSNNNSFYFWRHVNEIEDNIDKKFIMKRNKQNKKVYKTLSKEAKKNIIWKNSIKHRLAYKNADMVFVTLSYKDVKPIMSLKKKVAVPVVYLQHGMLSMKKIGYTGNSYNNNMFRFFYYNRFIKDVLKKENDFKDYQLYYGEFQPRYIELVKKYEEFNKQEDRTKSILWFVTWREYFGKNEETKELINDIKRVINNPKLQEFLKTNNIKFRICLHQFFEKEKIKYITNNIKNENIEIVTPKQIDVMDELAQNDILITDYSSVALDFTLLGKPVLLYQPDIVNYSKNREFYYLDEMKKYSISKSDELVEKLINNELEVNNFFKSKLPEIIDFEYLKQGKHIDKIYEDYKTIQENEITFLGYNFFGRGGTISATLALAEGLLEKNYLVKLISLKRKGGIDNMPYGLNTTAFYYAKRWTVQFLLKKALFIGPWHYGDLKYDSNRQYLLPYVGYALRKKMKNIKSRTVISTRETLHLFLKKAESENIKNKVYFFHTVYNVVESQFPGLIEELEKYKLEKAVFITELGRKQYKEIVGYDHYDQSIVLNNCLDSSRMIAREKIKPIEPKNKYQSIYLLRISKDRIDDINNLIEFAKYMKEKEFNKLTIHVYGVGDYTEEFEQRLIDEKLEDYIVYEGLAVNVPEEMEKYDLVTDFTLNHSFGMTYLEAILNGKMVFGMINQGSKEALKDLPYCYIHSFDDLLEKIDKLDKITLEDLRNNYDVIYNKYSRDVMAEKLIKYLD